MRPQRQDGHTRLTPRARTGSSADQSHCSEPRAQVRVGNADPRPSALGPSSHPHTGPGTLQGHRGWRPRGYVSALASPLRPSPCPQGQLTPRNLPLAFCLESWFSEALKAHCSVSEPSVSGTLPAEQMAFLSRALAR